MLKIYGAGSAPTFDQIMASGKPIIEATAQTLKDAMSKGFKGLVVQPDEAFRARLTNDIWVFSGCKTYHELKEVTNLMKTEGGSLKPFTTFIQDVKQTYDKYNRDWLRAEYNHAVGSSRMAAKWQEYESDTHFNLQYRTAGDEKVRSTHAALDNTTLPPDDPFWNEYYPPNGWNCRCDVVQVEKWRYTESDSLAAQKEGEKATTYIDKQGRNRSAMFRFNPGKEGALFPEQHPFYSEAPKRKIEGWLKENTVGSGQAAVGSGQSAVGSTFTPAKTIDECKNFAKNSLGITIDNRKLSVQALNSINESLFELKKEYDFDKRLWELGMTKNDRACARASRGYINFNKKWFEKTDADVIKNYKRGTDTGWWPKINDSIDPRKMIVDHEFAHCLTNIELAVNGDTASELIKIAKRYNKEMTNLINAKIDYTKSANFISKYAEKNYHEFIAEAFTAARNMDNPNIYAKEVHEVLKNKYGRK